MLVLAYLVVTRVQSVTGRAAAVVGLVAFGVAMGFSRVYLGHHSLTDVIACWAVRAGVVVLSHRVFLALLRRRERSGRVAVNASAPASD